LGQLGARKAKQKGRDWADKYNQKGDDEKSWLGKKVAGIFDTSKTTDKKQARYEKTADTLMAMTGADQETALKTLGIHDYANVDQKRYESLRQLLTQINFDVPLMGFNLHEDIGFVYFRTVQVVPASPDAGTGATMVDMVSVAHFLVTRYAETLAQNAR